MKITLCFLFLIMLTILSTTVLALEPDEILSDPSLEQRARNISQTLRCLVCQGETIDTSSTPFAHDARAFIRQRLTAGDTDQEIITAMTSRYGDSVLLKPPFKANTFVLWLGPLFILIGGSVPVVLFLWKQQINKKKSI